MASEPKRQGMNGAEATLLRLMAERNASVELLDGLEPGPSEDLQPVAEELARLSGDERSEVLEEWVRAEEEAEAPEGYDSPAAKGRWAKAVRRWREGEPFEWIESRSAQRAVRGVIEQWATTRTLRFDEHLKSEESYHFDALLEMEPPAFREFCVELGVFQMAVLLQGENRRRIARVSRQLSRDHRQMLVDVLREERDVEPAERTRLREVFVTLSRHFEEIEERVFQLGIYSVARAAGYRFRDRIEVLCESLPGGLSSRLDRYYRLSYGSTRRGVGRHFRRSLETFLAWRDEREE